MSIEQIKEILAGAPSNDWTHYCKRNRQYFKRDGNTDRIFVWLGDQKVWSVPLVDVVRWLERRARLEEILELRQRVAELEAQLDQLHGQQDSKAITMLFGLMGYLTSMEEPITFSAYHNATPGADIVSRLIQANELKGDCDWDIYKPPKEQSK